MTSWMNECLRRLRILSILSVHMSALKGTHMCKNVFSVFYKKKLEELFYRSLQISWSVRTSAVPVVENCASPAEMEHHYMYYYQWEPGSENFGLTGENVEERAGKWGIRKKTNLPGRDRGWDFSPIYSDIKRLSGPDTFWSNIVTLNYNFLLNYSSLDWLLIVREKTVYLQGVQEKLCFFTIHCNPSLASTPIGW